MIYPFLQRCKDATVVRLHKDLYAKNLIDMVNEEEPNTVVSVKERGVHYLVELNIDTKDDYLNFLNYLVYCNRIT